MGAKTFKTIAGTICRQLRASEKAPGEDQIFTAGEKKILHINIEKNMDVSSSIITKIMVRIKR